MKLNKIRIYVYDPHIWNDGNKFKIRLKSIGMDATKWIQLIAFEKISIYVQHVYLKEPSSENHFRTVRSIPAYYDIFRLKINSQVNTPF